MNPELEFLGAISSAGLPVPGELRADGRLHRFSTNGKRHDDAGWYVLFLDGVAAGAFGDWRAGVSGSWCAKADLSAQEDLERRERIRLARAMAEQQREAARAIASARSGEIWAQAGPDELHQYASKKGVKGYGLRVHHGELVIGGMDCDGALIVPMINIDGELRSLQFISPEGEKRFLPGGQKAGCFHVIGRLQQHGVVAVCEGWATGASLHECLGEPVVVAFDAGNLVTVADILRKRMPLARFLICGDNDER